MGATLPNDFGKIIIDEDVLASIAGRSATECYGIVGMSAFSTTGGWADILKRENWAKGVKILVANELITIELGIIVKYGVSISTVADNVIDNVSFNVEHLTGMKVEKVNVQVKGIRV